MEEFSTCPSFLTSSLVNAIIRAGKALRLLQNHCPRHPVLSEMTQTYSSWAFTHAQVQRVRVVAYELDRMIRQTIVELEVERRAQIIQEKVEIQRQETERRREVSFAAIPLCASILRF